MEERIYIITAIEFGLMWKAKLSPDNFYHHFYSQTHENQKSFFTIRHSRTWGWFKDLKIAQECVESNALDMHENQYNHIVIEQVKEGMVTNIPEKEFWYEWKDGKYIESTKPKEYENIIGFWGIYTR